MPETTKPETDPPTPGPCPWCGNVMEVVTDGDPCPSEAWLAWSFCRACGARGPWSKMHYNRYGYDGKADAVAEAVERCNRRPPHPDAARLDLVERHGLAVSKHEDQWQALEPDGSDPGGYLMPSRRYPSVRDAIDATTGSL